MEYLKGEQHYINLYDLITIKNCLEALDVCTSAYKKSIKGKKTKDFIAEMAKASNWYSNQYLYQIMGNRYSEKEETIQKWMDKDSVLQDKYDNTPILKHITCPDCKKLMEFKIKDLNDFQGPLRMMFLFECPTCKKKRWIYEDGIEYESKPLFCSKCKTGEISMSLVKKTRKKITWKNTCKSCGHSEISVDNLGKDRKEFEDKEKKDKLLLEQYQEQFCSEEVGKKWFEYVESLKVAEVVYDEEYKKYDSIAYQKVSQIKTLSIGELEILLNKLLTKEGYAKLSLDKPEMGQHVIVSFNLQDSNSPQKQEVISNLQKLIQTTLEGTNWRLMSDGLSYRLGYISGRLKGYESEDDYLTLSGEKKEEKPSKLDYETRMKYTGNNVVELARMMGNFNGVKDIRKRKLKLAPEGFFLNATEGPYTCGICGNNVSGDKTWWNLDGVRCADCQRNIKERVIPSTIHKDSDIWFADWQLSSELHFDIHPSTAKKLRRQGLLHGRDLKKENGEIYFTVYLIEENKEFLKTHERKSRQSMIITDLLGNKVEL